VLGKSAVLDFILLGEVLYPIACSDDFAFTFPGTIIRFIRGTVKHADPLAISAATEN